MSSSNAAAHASSRVCCSSPVQANSTGTLSSQSGNVMVLSRVEEARKYFRTVRVAVVAWKHARTLPTGPTTPALPLLHPAPSPKGLTFTASRFTQSMLARVQLCTQPDRPELTWRAAATRSSSSAASAEPSLR